MIAGQGSAAKELFEEVGELDLLLVPVGGGGLISGCALAAAALSPRCAVIGVEPEAGNDVQQSLRRGEIVRIETPRTIADGAQTTATGPVAFGIMQRLLREIVTVSDPQLVTTMQFLASRMKLLVEPTGCLGAAAALERVVPLSGLRVGVLLSGGNVDLARFCSLISDRALEQMLLPFLRWRHDWRNPQVVRADLMAGLTGAVVVLPQAVAYATLAGMPIQYGLYAAMVPCLVAALFGSSRLMVTGPANAISLTTAYLISPLAEPFSAALRGTGPGPVLSGRACCNCCWASPVSAAGSTRCRIRWWWVSPPASRC